LICGELCAIFDCHYSIIVDN